MRKLRYCQRCQTERGFGIVVGTHDLRCNACGHTIRLEEKVAKQFEKLIAEQQQPHA